MEIKTIEEAFPSQKITEDYYVILEANVTQEGYLSFRARNFTPSYNMEVEDAYELIKYKFKDRFYHMPTFREDWWEMQEPFRMRVAEMVIARLSRRGVGNTILVENNEPYALVYIGKSPKEGLFRAYDAPAIVLERDGKYHVEFNDGFHRYGVLLK